jgi:hypothetical protein
MSQLIDTNTGNPILIRETIQNLLSTSDFKKKYNNIFGGTVDISYLNYQKEPTKEFEDIVRFYYDKILNRPLTQTDYIVITDGILNAVDCVCWSIQKLMGKTCFDPLKIYQINKPPTYNIYKNIEQTIPNCIFNYNGEFDIKTNSGFNAELDTYINKSNYILTPNYNYVPDVGLIISPNNPTGEIINERRGKWQIIDAAYDLPLFTGQSKSVNTKFSDHEIYIQSISKLGVPSYRFGWFITNDPMIYSKAYEYKKIYNIGQNMASLSMGKNYFETIYNTGIFNKLSNITYKTLKIRRKEISNIFSKYKIYDINTANIYAPYLFLPINNSIFESIGISTRPGKDFFYSDNFSRINLMMESNDYIKMLKILLRKQSFQS